MVQGQAAVARERDRGAHAVTLVARTVLLRVGEDACGLGGVELRGDNSTAVSTH